MNSQIKKDVLSIIILIGLLTPIVTILAYDVSGQVTSFEAEKCARGAVISPSRGGWNMSPTIQCVD